MGFSLGAMMGLVRSYRRAQNEVSLCLARRDRTQETTFSLDSFSSEDCLSLFRFLPHHIVKLVSLLHLVVPFPRKRLAVDPVECFCVVLRRLASPCRWYDMEELFGRHAPASCVIFYATLEVLMHRWDPLLSEWRVDFLRERAALYSTRIEEAGAYLDKCVGFIDGTTIFVSRPGRGFQRACYSGHKRRHAIKFQSVITPDGLIAHLLCPWEGHRHDMTLYHESGLDAVLSDALVIQGVQHYIYGDAAYLVRPWLQASFRGVMTPNEEACNETMKVPRSAVEWGFRDVKQVCASFDFPRKLKIREGPVGLFYRAGVLIWNLRCCAYGSATADFFKCPPPSWEVFLGSLPGLGGQGAAAGSTSGEESGPSGAGGVGEGGDEAGGA